MLPSTQVRARSGAMNIDAAIDPQWPPDKLLETWRVAKLINMSKSWLEKGRIYSYGPPFIRMRRSGSKVGAIRYRLSAVVRWLEEQQCDPEAGCNV